MICRGGIDFSQHSRELPILDSLMIMRSASRDRLPAIDAISRGLLLCFLFLSFSGKAAYGQSIPENAHRTLFGGWECDRGYEQVGDRCQKIDVPENASLTLTGHDWRCDRGYQQVGQRCESIDVPKNASLTILGNDWSCDRGYRQVGKRCEPIDIPENASLNLLGNDWRCDRGYERVKNRCERINIPENASLNLLGTGWTCNEGYVRRNNGCIPIERATDDEIRELIISKSISFYSGSCPCPYNTDSAGRRCGERSAYSRSGGRSPICYESNISDEAVERYRNKY